MSEQPHGVRVRPKQEFSRRELQPLEWGLCRNRCTSLQCMERSSLELALEMNHCLCRGAFAGEREKHEEGGVAEMNCYELNTALYSAFPL